MSDSNSSLKDGITFFGEVVSAAGRVSDLRRTSSICLVACIGISASFALVKFADMPWWACAPLIGAISIYGIFSIRVAPGEK